MIDTTDLRTLTTRWTTIATVGYRDTAYGARHTPRGENRAAHGGVCYLQARKGDRGVIYGRQVNGNVDHEEVGEPWALDADDVARWEALAENAR